MWLLCRGLNVINLRTSVVQRCSTWTVLQLDSCVPGLTTHQQQQILWLTFSRACLETILFPPAKIESYMRERMQNLNDIITIGILSIFVHDLFTFIYDLLFHYNSLMISTQLFHDVFTNRFWLTLGNSSALFTISVTSRRMTSLISRNGGSKISLAPSIRSCMTIILTEKKCN